MSSGKNRMLIIDDDTSVQSATKRVFERAGYDVTQSFDGEDGFRAATSGVYDVILLDVTMPGMDGRDLLSKLKRDPQRSRIPIVVYSANAEVLARRLAIELGADEYVEKPCDPKYLIPCVNRLVERSREALAADAE